MTTKSKQCQLGDWKVKRKGDYQLIVTLPDGMEVTDDDITIEDILSAIANKKAIDSGRVVVKCCSGNIAIA